MILHHTTTASLRATNNQLTSQQATIKIELRFAITVNKHFIMAGLPKIYLLLISVANELIYFSNCISHTQLLIYSSFGHRLRMISLQSNNKQQAFFVIITVLLITKIARATLIKPNYLFTNSRANSKSNYSIIK